jgi:hypothetical protein
MSQMGLGRVKTKYDLVVMPSGRQIFAFFCSPHDHRAQNSRCGDTARSFYTVRVMERRTRRNHFSSAAPQRADLRAAVGSRDFGGFRQATTQPTMGYILVDARMPYGDHIETRDFDRRLAHDQSFVAGAQQAGWKECHKIVGLQLSLT